MIAKRPIYYTILPSLVIIIGYVWYRRKRNGRVDCDTGGGSEQQKLVKEEQQQKSCKLLGDNQELISSSEHSFALSSHPSESLPIGTPQKLNINCNNNEEGLLTNQSQSPDGRASSSSSSSLCKSAPIDIAPNPRSPPKRVTEQEIDCEILKLKPQESDIRNLLYIEEPDIDSDLDETPTPADSPPYRARVFNKAQNSSGASSSEPVIVKGTMEAKVSPENSFRERKYTHTESDEAEERRIHKSNDNSNDNGCVMMQDDDVEVTEAIQSNIDQAPTSENSNQQPQIASPSLSMCSMHSGDSGQGSSPPQSVGAAIISYDTLLPAWAVSAVLHGYKKLMIKIKDKTGANLILRKAPFTNNRKSYNQNRICTIEGTQSEIDAAIEMLRKNLEPRKGQVPVTLARIFLTPDNQVVPSFDMASLQLKLIEGINNDVSVCSVISGNHLFLQQPLHPSYPNLALLQQKMNAMYSMTTAPELPELIDNAVCAYCIQNNWYRVQIVSHNQRDRMCLVKYLDFGGYSDVHANELRQIHADFMTTPFQAIECVLSNVRAPNGEEWPMEAMETILNFSRGVVLQAQVAGYTDDDVPEILLYVLISQDVSIKGHVFIAM